MRRRIPTSVYASFAAGVIIFVVFFLVNGGFVKPTPRLWADGSAIAGVLILLAVFFRRVARTGYFDYAAYFVYMAKYLLKRNEKCFLNYFDYKSTIEHGTAPLCGSFAVGCVFLAIGVLLFALQ